MKATRKNRVLALVLALVMAAGLLPVSALAWERADAPLTEPVPVEADSEAAPAEGSAQPAECVYTVEPIAAQSYTGESIRPAVILMRDGTEMDPADYAVFYRNNVEVGTATVIVRVNGNIVARAAFQILDAGAADEYTIGDIAERVYTGRAIESPVIVRRNGKLIEDGYTVAFSDNVNVGTATVTVLVDGVAVATTTFQIVGAPVGGGGNAGALIATPTLDPAPAEEIVEEPEVPLAALPMLVFADVKANDWYYEAVKYSFDQNVMTGETGSTFAPAKKTNRATLLTILYRLEKEPEVAPAQFADVSAGRWYAASAAWGQKSGIVTGTEDENFRPMKELSREELAAFLYRYAAYKGYDISARGDLTGFRDSASVAGWAGEYMSWAVGAGLLQGKDNNRLDPKGTATRAEVASILMRFCKSFGK